MDLARERKKAEKERKAADEAKKKARRERFLRKDAEDKVREMTAVAEALKRRLDERSSGCGVLTVTRGSRWVSGRNPSIFLVIRFSGVVLDLLNV